MAELPPPGRIVSRAELPGLAATELVLSNGMRVRALLGSSSSGRLA